MLRLLALLNRLFHENPDQNRNEIIECIYRASTNPEIRKSIIENALKDIESANINEGLIKILVLILKDENTSLKQKSEIINMAIKDKDDEHDLFFKLIDFDPKTEISEYKEDSEELTMSILSNVALMQLQVRETDPDAETILHAAIQNDIRQCAYAAGAYRTKPVGGLRQAGRQRRVDGSGASHGSGHSSNSRGTSISRYFVLFHHWVVAVVDYLQES